MTKMKIYEITRSLEGKFPDIKSKDIVKLLNDNGFEAKTAQSNIEDEAIRFLLVYFKKLEKEQANNVNQAAAPKKKPVKKKEKESDVKALSTSAKKEEKATTKEEKDSKAASKKKAETKEAKPTKATKEEPVKEEAKEETKAVKEEKPKKVVEEKTAKEEKPVDSKPQKKEAAKKDEPKKEKVADNRPKKDGAASEKKPFDSNRNRDKDRPRRDDRQRNDRSGNQRRDNRNDNGDRRQRNDSNFNRDNRDNQRRDFQGQGAGRKDQKDRREKNFSDSLVPANQRKGDRDRRKQKDKDRKERNNKGGYNRNKANDFNPLYPDGVRPRKPKKQGKTAGAFIMPVAKKEEPADTIKEIKLPEVMTISELATSLKVKTADIIKSQMLKGNLFTVNQQIDFDEAERIALEYNVIAEKEEKVDLIAELLKEDEENEDDLQKRPPVVCVMGHVDHGKTSLLDAIRETSVTSREAGGITQHIGAYVTEINGQKITFLDTPGHEAFTAMRMRGAEATDIAVLVVAADDGVMPQTIEAINHAKAAGVEIIVAVNKIDKPSANVERVKQELMEYELVAEDWGGSTIFAPVSAHTKEGIDNLLEMIILTAEVSELKANPNRNARGVVIEAQLDKGRGPVATVLVQKGTLHVGDNIAVGAAYGKVRAMTNDLGQRVKEATPSMPVEIIGLHDVPEAGEIFMAVDSDKEAKNIAATYVKESREKMLSDTKSKLTLDGLFDQIKAGEIKELDLIVKADVQGSVEAVKQSLVKLSNDEVQVRVIHAGVGAINESDVELASASNAIIIGFNVRPDNSAKETAEREKVDVRLYRVIYDAIEDIEAAMKGMLDPEYEEKIIAHLEVRQTFKASGIGIIAGSYVLDGKIERGSQIRIFREGELIHEGELQSLKRFQDDVKEVATGFECGVVIKDFNGIQVEDQIEAFKMVEVPRT